MGEIRAMWKHEENIKLIDQMKNAWKRERPYQKFPDVYAVNGTETETYAFPSGHACGAYYIASKLAKKYPQLEDGLMHLADRIAKSRVQAGVHYPSDIEAGKAIGTVLANR